MTDLFRRAAWSDSMIQAQQYVRSAVATPLSGAEGLRQYREGGGAIRTQDWYSVWRETASAFELRETISTLPEEYTIPQSWMEPTGMRFRERFIYQAEVITVDAEGGRLSGEWYTVESAQPLTITEWQADLESIILMGDTRPGVVEYEITDTAFLVRAD